MKDGQATLEVQMTVRDRHSVRVWNTQDGAVEQTGTTKAVHLPVVLSGFAEVLTIIALTLSFSDDVDDDVVGVAVVLRTASVVLSSTWVVHRLVVVVTAACVVCRLLFTTHTHIQTHTHRHTRRNCRNREYLALRGYWVVEWRALTLG